MDWEFGVNRCTLLYIEWINKVLLYSIKNYIQYPVINHKGKEYEKEYTYIYLFNRVTDTENRLVFAKVGRGTGWSGSVGLVDAK